MRVVMRGPRSTVRSLGRALRSRNYRLFFAGQSISLIGTWLTRVATSWLDPGKRCVVTLQPEGAK